MSIDRPIFSPADLEGYFFDTRINKRNSFADIDNAPTCLKQVVAPLSFELATLAGNPNIPGNMFIYFGNSGLNLESINAHLEVSFYPNAAENSPESAEVRRLNRFLFLACMHQCLQYMQQSSESWCQLPLNFRTHKGIINLLDKYFLYNGHSPALVFNEIDLELVAEFESSLLQLKLEAIDYLQQEAAHFEGIWMLHPQLIITDPSHYKYHPVFYPATEGKRQLTPEITPIERMLGID